MRDHLIVRPARPDDIDALVTFSAAMARETEGRELELERLRRGTLAVFGSPERGFYLVAELSGEPSGRLIGQLMVTYEWSDWRNATFWWIQSVYVHPSWRRRGVYRRMHECILHQARSRSDVCGVRLYVEKNNAVAHTAYDHVGLSRSGYVVFEDDFVLSTKELHGKE
ncbi:MAG: GNAT family N-acetyltransferase [Nitrospiraceae bacterium]